MFSSPMFVQGYEIIEKELDYWIGRRLSDGKQVIIRSPNDEREGGLFYRNYFFTNIAATSPQYIYTDIVLKKGPILICGSDIVSHKLCRAVKPNEGWQADGKQGLVRFLQFAKDCSQGLEDIHKSVKVHGNITPDSIIYDPDTHSVKYSSFEYAATASETLPFPSRRKNDEFDPPEKNDLNTSIDYRADFYSLGAVLLYCWSGNVRDTASLATLPSPLMGIIMTNLSSSPENRYQTESHLVADIERCADEFLSEGHINQFQTNENQRDRRLNFSSTIYGRDRVVSELSSMMDASTEDASIGCLLEGQAGVGKSRLVEYLMVESKKKDALVGCGKFDQPATNEPNMTLSFNALMAALESLLISARESVSTWRAKLESLVQDHGTQVLQIAIPAMAPYLDQFDDTPVALDVDPVAQQGQVEDARLAFYRMCAADRPVLFILEDVHWADEATVKFLATLVKARIPRLFVLCTCRPEISPTAELGPFHDLHNNCQTVQLTPLDIESIQAWIAELFNQSQADATEIAAIILDKTGGYPFSIKLFIERVLVSQHVSFNGDVGWAWDLSSLSRIAATDDEFLNDLIKNIEELTDPITLRMVQLCACLGTTFSHFDLITISSCAMGITPIPFISDEMKQRVFGKINYKGGGAQEYAVEIIAPAIASNILCHNFDESFKFQHDRLRQAALESISTELISSLRLVLGCIFLDSPQHVQIAASQFNAVPEAVSKVSEGALLNEIVRLNDAAGQQCLRQFSFDNYRRYSYYATEYLNMMENPWDANHDMAFSAYVHYAEALSLCGVDASQLYPTLEAHAQTVDQTIAVLQIKIHRSHLDGEARKVGEYARQALRVLGVATYPERDDLLEADMQHMVESIDIDALQNADEWPRCSDKYHQLAILWIGYMTLGMYFDYVNMTPKNQWKWWALTGLRILIEKKQYVDSLSTLLSWSAGVMPSMNRIEQGEKLEMYSVREYPQNPHANADIARCNNHFFITHFHTPFSVNLVEMRRAHEGLMGELDGRQLTYRPYSAINVLRLLLYEGHEPLDHVLGEAQKKFEEFTTFAAGFGVSVFKPNYVNVCQCLVGATKGPGTLDTQDFSEVEYEKNIQLMSTYWHIDFVFAKMYTLFWAGSQLKQALVWTEKMEHFGIHSTDGITQMHMVFYGALILLQAAHEADSTDKSGYIARAKPLVDQVRMAAEACRPNYLHKYLIVQGELYHVNGDVGRAWTMFRQAIASCQHNDITNLRGLASEMLGRMLLETHVPDVADDMIQISDEPVSMSALSDPSVSINYLADARHCYCQWGCVIRVKYIDSTYGDLPVSHGEVEDASSFHAIGSDAETMLLNAPVGVLVVDWTGVREALKQVIEELCPVQLRSSDWRAWLVSEFTIAQKVFEKEKRLYQNKLGRKWTRGTALDVLKSAKDSLKNNTVEVCWNIFNGSKEWRCNYVPLMDDHGVEHNIDINWSVVDGHEDSYDLCVAVMTDVTSAQLENEKGYAKKLELQGREMQIITAEKLQALRHAQQVQKMRLDEMKELENVQMGFIDTLCHELRNPLNGLIAGIEILHKSLPSSVIEDSDIFEDLDTSCSHLRVIVDDVLDYSKLKSGSTMVAYKPFKPHRVGTAVISMFRSAVKSKNLDMVVCDDISPDLMILGDETRLAQVLANLVSNAIKFTPTSGKISFEMCLKDTPTSMLQFKLTDTGIGISQSHQKNLFAPFRFSRPSVDSSFGGSGLGLSISQQLVHRMGGSISVESVEGEGTKMVVAIPYERVDDVHDEPPISVDTTSMMQRLNIASSADSSDAEPNISTISVLCADDAAVNRRVLKGLLKLIGVNRCSFAKNGKEAWDMYKEGEFDIVLMDIEMPEMDGFDASEQIRAFEAAEGRENVPIVALTGFVGDAHKERAVKVGMSGYMTKPLNADGLSKVIRQCMKKKKT